MTASSLPSEPSPKDSEPPAIPSVPPGTAALWGDSDLGAVLGPKPAFATNAMNQPDDQMPTIGHIGRYALKYRLGEGGLGTVFAAHDPLLSRLIAVKTLNLELDVSERESFNRLFLNEARAAAGLSHPHIVTVFDAGISDNRVYIAMELLKGRDLRQLRQEGWRATPTQAALIVRRVADALAYAHSKGVVHRDVKPANIFMVGRTQPRVLDFGIARIAHRHEGFGESTTSGDIVAGSPYYMSPEQIRRESVDRRADVFSLGVVLYELLTDKKPFGGSTLEEITASVCTHEPVRANKVDPNVPEALAEIAARAMEKNPEHRFRSARAFSRELRHWLEENAVAADGDAAPSPSRRRWLWGGVAAAALLAVGAGIFAWTSHRQGAAPETAEAAPNVMTAATTAGTTAGTTSATTSATPADGAANPTTTTAAAANTTPPASAAAPVVANASAVMPSDLAAETTPLASASPAASTPTPATPATALLAAAPTGTPGPVAATPAIPDAPGAAPAAGIPAPAAASAPRKPVAATKAAAPKETAKERRAREAREREAKLAAAKPAAPAQTGVLRLAVSPWGQVEIDGRAVGTTPPLTELTLPEGAHQIVIRNSDLPPYSASVSVTAGQTASLKYKF